MASRRLRAFNRWMKSKGFQWSDALEFVDTPGEGIAVRALCQLEEGDVVAKMPKEACLTTKTSGAREIIEEAGLDGHLGLAFAIMYERSLGEDSPWYGYLQLLPYQECVPIVWTLNEVNELLCGTELHQTVQEDKALIYEDWKENILPLLDSAPLKLNPKFFEIEQYFAAKSLISSRSFEIDDYHGFGMVPLADLFNHKTGAEDVHFTAMSSNYESGSDVDGSNNDEGIVKEEVALAQNSSTDMTASIDANVGNNIDSGLESSSVSGDDTSMLEMITIKDVSSGTEVFNTYGLLGNAALLHRYGFTEKDNSYDIVNIDMELVLQWCSSAFSDRHSRARVSLWRRLGYSACGSQDSEYFEISFDGEPQIELLILLHIMLLLDDAYQKLDLSVSVAGNCPESNGGTTHLNGNIFPNEVFNMSKKSLLSKRVCDALLSLADMRESLYGLNSVEDDIEALERCSLDRERKLYHSLVLRINERKILQKLRNYASQPFEINKHSSPRKKLKRTKKKD
ncbi:ribosomal lysine N-methyltransferase 3 isoform X1 [Vigna umbellata]|uniref:ribosomal lysine N-methyltransferase 3 isoform X1 n=2 Tax=Vigna umbellata TaxID=87088 RepID=UPI001F5ED086|nr:ribosomal lysine N-methyltransferase 3 isoform X1 [Vigna umbellata]